MNAGSKFDEWHALMRVCVDDAFMGQWKNRIAAICKHTHINHQNACPRCGDHASSWGQLPRWDGRLAEETKVHVVKEEGLKSIVDKVPRRVSVAESPDFFLHIQYPIEGFLLIQPSLGDRIIPLAISYKKHHCWQVLRHSNRNECSPSADASYVFRCPPTAINVCSFLLEKLRTIISPFVAKG